MYYGQVYELIQKMVLLNQREMTLEMDPGAAGHPNR